MVMLSQILRIDSEYEVQEGTKKNGFVLLGIYHVMNEFGLKNVGKRKP